MNVNTKQISVIIIIRLDNVKDGQCIMSVDYKEKIKIGGKKIEQSWVFRNMKLRNCLGIILSFTDEKFVFFAITNISNQTALLSKLYLLRCS